MTLTPVSLTLAVTTAWIAIFLGALRAPLLRFYSRELLRVGAGWVFVALTAPAPIFHWYLIFAFIVLVAWFHVRRERFLAARVWLSIAAGLGISIGVVFLLQSAPPLFPVVLPGRDAVLLLASIYLGGAVTGAAWTGALLWRDPYAASRSRGFARLLFALALVWMAAVGIELRWLPDLPAFRPVPLLHLDSRVLLAPLALLVALSAPVITSVRAAAPDRAVSLFVLIAILGFGTQIVAHLLLL